MIVFFSNFFNDHQIPLCKALYDKTGGKFFFVEMEKISEERLKLGFKDKSSDYPFVIQAHKSEENYKKATVLANTADVVIFGSAPEELFVKRIKDNKLTFKYTERFFDKGRWRILDPRVLKCRYKNDFRFRKNNYHVLCASAYTGSDCRFVFSYPNKTYKWGYFREVSSKSIDQLLSLKNNGNTKLIWVARYIDWKHPEEAINLAERLKKDGIDFSLEMVGVGELREKIENSVTKKGLSDIVSFSGPISPEEVIDKMERSDIFIMTSDKEEGWGAVLNEAMTSACAVVGCNEIGSVPYLIKHGENGFIYKKRGRNSLFKYVSLLIKNRDLREKLQKNAYYTIKDLWNAEVAAERFIELIEKINNNEPIDFVDGPCSRD